MSEQRRFDLRAGTRAEHERLDAEIGAFADLTSYKRYLCGLARFRLPIERLVSSLDFPAQFGDWRPTAIAADLAGDLNDLRLGPGSMSGIAQPRPADSSELLGMLYVLEGSALGAEILRRRAGALGLDGEFGARHLARQTRDHSQWRAFLDLLDAAPFYDPARARAGAKATFEHARLAFVEDAHVRA